MMVTHYTFIPPPEDRSDLVAMAHWVADSLDERDLLVFRTVVRRLAEEVETLRAVLRIIAIGDGDARTFAAETLRILSVPSDTPEASQ